MDDLAICDNKLQAYTTSDIWCYCNFNKLNLTNNAIPLNYINCLTKFNFYELYESKCPKKVITVVIDYFDRYFVNWII